MRPPQVVLVVKNSPANAGDMQVRFLGGEDPLEEEMAACSSILVWRIPWTEESGGLQSMESQKSQKQLSNQTTTISIDNKSEES